MKYNAVINIIYAPL